jgi:hypothetical protein
MDNVKARILQPDGKYILGKIVKGEELLSSQELFMKGNLNGLNKLIKQKILT